MKSYNDAFKIIILLQIALFGDLNNTHSPDKPEFTLSIQQEIRNKIPRPEGYDPLKIMHLEKPLIKELGESGENCWEAILKKDVAGLGKAVKDTFLSWKKILPLTVPDWIMNEMETKYFPNYAGAITSGSGGGYVIVVSEKAVGNAFKIKIRN